MKIIDSLLDKESFKEEILKNYNNVLVLFNARYSMFSDDAKKYFREISDNTFSTKEFLILEADRNYDLVEKIGISSLPAIYSYKDGKKIAALEGVFSKDDILNLV
ncbi:MAG: thioredoxin domain-containing protein [Tissierellia bacterium]|nr:thioredoxin domain-containing protein [Tissierellia bacterium]